jgi:hypothetical protein
MKELPPVHARPLRSAKVVAGFLFPVFFKVGCADDFEVRVRNVMIEKKTQNEYLRQFGMGIYFGREEGWLERSAN